MRLAGGREPLGDAAARAKLEAPYRNARGRTIELDLVIEAEDGTILEIVECKEHAADIPADSVTKFLKMVEAMRGAPGVTSKTIFRYATIGRDFGPGAREAMKKTRNVIWDLDLPRKDELSARSIVYLMDLPRDARDSYTRMFAYLADQMAQRLPEEKDDLRVALRNVHAEIYRGSFGKRFQKLLDLEAADSFDIAQLRRRFEARVSTGARAMQRSRDAAGLRRELFEGSGVTLDQIFVQPHAELTVPAGTKSDLHFGSGEALLLRWLSERWARRNEARPLLVLGHFGSGKSSLLDRFHRTLVIDSDIVPIPIALRKLVSAEPGKTFRSVLTAHLRDAWSIDLDRVPEDDELRYCLLCDGFDELNLYYAEQDPDQWARSCLADLTAIAERPDVAVIVSSRPILLMSLFEQRMAGDPKPTLWLKPFDDDRIREWTSKFRAAQPKAKALSLDFLRERNLLEVARTPIVLFMIAQVLAAGEKLRARQKYTRAEVYRLFIDWTASGGYRADERKHKVPPNYREILQDIAWFIFQSGQQYVREDALLEHLRAKHGKRIGDVLVARNLLVAHMLKPLGTDAAQRQLVEFTHQSFREYLVVERTWDLLAEARATGTLDPAKWRQVLGNVVFTDAKIELLGELVSVLPEDEATRLYNALGRAEQVHQYWNWFSKPVWDEVRDGRDVDAAKNYFDTLAPRALALAVLAFILRVKCLRRLTKLVISETTELPRLLQFADSFIAKERGTERDLLMRHLSGLRLVPGTHLARLRLDRAVLHGVRMEKVDFSQCALNDLKIRDASFRGSDFSRAVVHLVKAHNVSFRRCMFNGATIGMPDFVDLCSGLDFTGATFVGTEFGYLSVRNATFIGNRWDDARYQAVVSDSLEKCTLDAAAREFFERSGVQLVNCKFV
ncbi:MAG TPA: pentapeptide repeat-containing protein [Thermoanaerobaculia bacterium]|nr:pentapeptide repeat-containing protein [Thermoanaerobaculia bacterium]